jgi:DNA-binding response OmpR family regulator
MLRKHASPLIVDDSRYAAEIVRSILRSLGAASVRHAATDHEAFSLLRREPFDFAIIDQNLGRGEDGLDLVRRIRTDPESPNPFLPILMLTAYSERKRVVSARDAGVTEFLVKPFTARELVLRLSSLLDRPRKFVSCANYCGPDRRRRTIPDYKGPEKRSATQA